MKLFELCVRLFESLAQACRGEGEREENLADVTTRMICSRVMQAVSRPNFEEVLWSSNGASLLVMNTDSLAELKRLAFGAKPNHTPTAGTICVRDYVGERLSLSETLREIAHKGESQALSLMVVTDLDAIETLYAYLGGYRGE